MLSTRSHLARREKGEVNKQRRTLGEAATEQKKTNLALCDEPHSHSKVPCYFLQQ